MLDLHDRAMAHTVDIVQDIRDDQWDGPTPCADWTLGQLVQHMILENRGFAAAAGGETIDRTVWSLAEFADDLRADYVQSARQVSTAFHADGVLDREFWLPLIDDTRFFPAAQAISFHLLDYLVHGWDVAVAIGRPTGFEPELVRAVQEIADREVPDGRRRLRPGAPFRPAVAPSPGASDLDRLLAALGRSPSWPR